MVHARTGALVCFPYAGGNAVNFQPMAQALRGSGLAVYAVELPGHDVAATSESFAPMERVVEQVVAEITARGLKRGPALGPLVRRRLCRRDGQAAAADRGVKVQRVFLGAQLLGDAADRRAASPSSAGAATLTSHATAERGRRLHRARRAGRGTRRACRCRVPPRLRVGEPLFRRGPWKTRRRNGCPRRSPWWSLPTTRSRRGSAYGTGDWELLAEHVDLHELADGGHYFLRTRPAEAAQAVLCAAEMFAYS